MERENNSINTDLMLDLLKGEQEATYAAYTSEEVMTENNQEGIEIKDVFWAVGFARKSVFTTPYVLNKDKTEVTNLKTGNVIQVEYSEIPESANSNLIDKDHVRRHDIKWAIEKDFSDGLDLEFAQVYGSDHAMDSLLSKVIPHSSLGIKFFVERLKGRKYYRYAKNSTIATKDELLALDGDIARGTRVRFKEEIAHNNYHGL